MGDGIKDRLKEDFQNKSLGKQKDGEDSARATLRRTSVYSGHKL